MVNAINMKKLTQKHKENISKSCLGKTKNNGKIWITNGYDLKRVLPEDLSFWKAQGYYKGKKLVDKPQIAWNKGLKASEDPRVAKMRRKPKK